MTARRRIDTTTKTPALDFLRSVVTNPKASSADRLKAALALAPTEKMASTRHHEPGVRQRAAEAATEASDWDDLLQ